MNRRPRDENGWRIPKDGTRRREVYDLLKAGKSRREIRDALPNCSDNAVGSLINQIRRPDARKDTRPFPLRLVTAVGHELGNPSVVAEIDNILIKLFWMRKAAAELHRPGEASPWALNPAVESD